MKLPGVTPCALVAMGLKARVHTLISSWPISPVNMEVGAQGVRYSSNNGDKVNVKRLIAREGFKPYKNIIFREKINKQHNCYEPTSDMHGEDNKTSINYMRCVQKVLEFSLSFST
jgi:hypothetical protein